MKKSIKTNIYQLASSFVRNIGGDIGNSLRIFFYRLSGAKIGRNVELRESVTIYSPYNLEIGDNTSIGVGTILSSRKKIKIGRNVGIGNGCSIYDNDHKMPLRPGGEEMIETPVEIKDGAWIGAHSVILRGVVLGKNVTIGAGSVVMKDVPDNFVVMGNPARVVKKNPEYVRK